MLYKWVEVLFYCHLLNYIIYKDLIHLPSISGGNPELLLLLPSLPWFSKFGDPPPPRRRHFIFYLRLAWNSWYSPHLQWTPGNLLLHYGSPPPFLLKTFKGPFRMVDFWFFPSPLYFWTWCLAFMYSVNLYNLARLLSFDLGNTEGILLSFWLIYL